MLPLLNYQSYKINFTIMISLLSIPFQSDSFVQIQKLETRKIEESRSGPVSKIPIRSAPNPIVSSVRKMVAVLKEL